MKRVGGVTAFFAALFSFGLFSATNGSAVQRVIEVMDPAVLFNQTQKRIDTLNQKSFKAALFGGEEVEWQGEVSFPESSMTFKHEVNFNTVKTSIPLSSLRELSVKEWTKKNLDKNEFAFYPGRYELVYEEEGKTKTVQVRENMEVFNRLTFVPETKAGTLGRKSGSKNYLYTYYVDYLRGNIWENSRVTNRRYTIPPAPGSVIRRIVFQKDS